MQLIPRDQPAKLSSAILFYGSSGNPQAAFASIHPVQVGADGIPVIKPGTPATRAGVLAALRTLIDERMAPCILPSHLLATGADHLVWYRPATKRVLWFRESKMTEALSAEVPIPALVWMANPLSDHCRVYALRDDKRPDNDTPLYQAPFFNVWANGKVCVGNAGFPKGNDALNPEKWEEAFFGSWFTHPNTNNLFRHKEGAEAFFKDWLSGKHRVFPKAKLFPLKTTLGEAFNKFIKEDAHGQA